eukprot:TRINITY_DN2330_c0_g2_i1.p1 TRINITY_DN2330_c0_g2~~TRINITY_DN2330_c0_g2_i1.p1  ORF type:complete len:841 (-),score=-40.49 TRINITY_DN2330_c0_g2_i1:39-2561(-)
MDLTSLTSPSSVDNAGMAPNNWRLPLAIRGRGPAVQTLDVKLLPESIQLANVSAFAVHNEWSVVAVANTGESRNVLTLLRIPSKSSKVTEPQVIARFRDRDISDLSWHGDKLLCATNDGSVLFFQIDPMKKPDEVKKVLPSEYFHVGLREDVPEPPVTGKVMTNSRVVRVAGNSTDFNLFLTLENNNMHLWDLEQRSEPLFSRKNFSDPPLAAEWSPHCEDKFMVGGRANALELYDLRLFNADPDKKPALSIKNAHLDAICDIKWSPFVPHWVASVGNFAQTRIWDLRFARKPVMVLQDHTNAINRLCWSPIYADVLATGASDRQMKLWSLNAAPGYVMATLKEFNGSVIGVGFSHEDPYQVYGVSTSGDFVTVQLSKAFLAPLADKVSRSSDTEEVAIERKIFFRDFAGGFRDSLRLAEQYRKEGKISNALSILELCYERQPPDPEGTTPPATYQPKRSERNKVNDDEDTRHFFVEDLRTYTYYIPPDYPSHLATPTDPEVMERIQLLKMNLELQLFVDKGQSAEILERMPEIYEFLTKDRSSIPALLMLKVLKVLTSDYYVKALEVGKCLADIYHSVGGWADFLPMARLLLQPTIYDTSQDASTGNQVSTMLATKLAKHEDVISQLDFMRSFYELLWSPDPNDQTQMISFVEDNKPEVVWNATTNRLFFNVLLLQNQYDKFYIESNYLVKVAEGAEFSEILNRLRNDAFPKLQNYLQECQIRTDKPSDLSQYRDALRIIINTLLNSAQLPKNVVAFLTPTLSQVQLDLENVLLELSTTDKAAAARGAEEIVEMLEGLTEGLTARNKYHSQIMAMLDMLRGFKPTARQLLISKDSVLNI